VDGSSFPFHLSVLGDPSLKDASGQTPPSLGWGKPLALLCLLAIRHEARREEVVDLLWRGVEESRARNAFRQALHRLRTAIGDDLLPQDRERLRLVRSDRLIVDLDRFEAAASAGRVEEAIACYTGDFLASASLGEPPFDMWVEQERARLRTQFRKVLEDAIGRASAAGQWSEAMARSRRLVAIAPFEASAAQLAATTLVSAGRRAEARDLLNRFATTLQSELGLSMPQELQTLLARIERQSEKHAVPAAGAAAIPMLPFVGREKELSRLVTLCRTTGEDAGGLALIEGEAFVGKSRLVRELAIHIKSLGRFTVLTGRERAIASVPYGIFAEALRPLVRAPGVLGASRHLLAEAARLLPELRDEIDLPAVSDVEDDAARVRFFEGIAALIDAAAFEQPIVLALEDLHHLTPSSLDLLAYLCARLSGSAVTFVLTARPADGSSVVMGRLRALATRSAAGDPAHGARAIHIVLEPLSHADAHAAASIIAQTARIPAATLDRVVQRAEGVPARLIELLRRAAAGEDIATLPVSVREMMAERMQRLSSGQRRLAFVLALIGRPVSVASAAAATHLPEGAAAEAIDVLEEHGLAEVDGGVVTMPDLAVHVAQEVAGDATRTFLSAWIAEALSARSDASPAELARFYAAAGEARPALEHSRRAAFSALGMGAVAESIQLFYLARTFAATLEERAEIESFLTSLGSGRKQLAPAARAPEDAASLVEPAVADVRRPPATSGAGSRAALGRWETLFPNWRILLGAAVGTLIVSAAVLALRPSGIQTAARSSLPDTLVVGDGESGRMIRYVTGGIAQGFSVSERQLAPPSNPAWIDSLSRPWLQPLSGPGGEHIALTRVTPSGAETYLISADRRDTVRLAEGEDTRPLGWSPDGRWVLVSVSRTLSDGTFDTDLFAFAAYGRGTVRRALDTTARRSIIEAAWSPDGSRIAWVARVGPERQLEVFVSNADGSAAINLTRHPADDNHIAWSPDGELLAFSSARDGNPELYAASLRENRLWRLTFDPAQDDGAAFSRDGRLVAFESTRGGSAGVYVMPALGGEPVRAGVQQQLTVRRWEGAARRYVDRVRVQVGDRLDPGDSTAVELVALDQLGEPIAVHSAEWSVLDSALARLVQPDDSASDSVVLVARRPGLARIVGNMGRWRYDTAFVRVGDRGVTLIEPSGDPLREWRVLGAPAPMRLAAGEIVLNADREWDSGVLSRRTLPVLTGLTLTATLDVPLGAARDPSTAVSVSLVAPEDPASIDAAAPQFRRYASFTWSADADRFVYTVGREVFSEQASSVMESSPFAVRLRVERDSTVSFRVDGRARWRSTLRVIGAGQEPRSQAWISGRATAGSARVSGIGVVLVAPDSLAAADSARRR
jgi:DNA-binding SARP family transcriptional activator